MRVPFALLAALSFVSTAHADTVLHTITGAQAAGETGAAVAIAGDVDGDGHADFVVTQPNYGVAPAIPERGAVRMYSGLDGHVLWTRTGSQPYQHLGAVVAAGSDATGDGVPDLLVQSPGMLWTDLFGQVRHGAVALLDGVNGNEVWFNVNPSLSITAYGSALSFVPDADADGRAELAIGDPKGFGEGPAYATEAGLALVYSTAHPFALLTAYGADAFDHLGAAVAGMPDGDGDGMPELAVGVPDRDTSLPVPPFNLDDTGQIKIYAIASFPPSSLVRTISNSLFEGQRLGAVLASGGDVDNDGHADLLAGLPDAGNGAMRVYSGVAYGNVGSLLGAANLDRYGAAVANAGDVNGDGWADIIVGAPNAADVPQAFTFNRGRVYTIAGRDFTTMATHTGSGNNAHLGAAVGGGADVNGDGRPDVIAGAPDQSSMGLALVLDVLDDPASWSLTGNGTAGTLGVPALTLSGPPETCHPVTLTLGNSRPQSTPTTLFLSAGFQPLVTGLGGTLYPQLPAIQSGIVLPVGGLAIPTNVPCDPGVWGVTVYLQQLVADPAAPQGVAFSRCLVATLGGF